MLDWNVIFHYFPFLLKGTLITLEISLLSLLLGLVFGLSAALCKLGRNPILRGIASFYIWIIRFRHPDQPLSPYDRAGKRHGRARPRIAPGAG